MRLWRFFLPALVALLAFSGPHQSPARAAEARAQGNPIIEVTPVGVWCDEAASFSIKVRNTTAVSVTFTFALTEPTSGGVWFELASKELLPPETRLGTLNLDDTCDRATESPCVRGGVVTSLEPGSSIQLITGVDGLALRAGEATLQVSFQLTKHTPRIRKDLRVRLTRATTRTACFLPQAV